MLTITPLYFLDDDNGYNRHFYYNFVHVKYMYLEWIKVNPQTIILQNCDGKNREIVTIRHFSCNDNSNDFFFQWV